MKPLIPVASCLLFLLASPPALAEKLTIAAASDLKFAMDEVAATFRTLHPGDEVEVIYGSSGQFHAQIQQNAPFDMFFSADIAYPRELVEAGLAASEVHPYAVGRIVLWSASLDAETMTLESLTDPAIEHIAIANPAHAPYGKRAEEALRAVGLWDQLEPRLVYGENIAQTAQFAQTGNADVGIIALALALNPELSKDGGYWLIPASLHEPLEQGFVITARAANNALAQGFADYMIGNEARMIMQRFGFVLPAETTHDTR